MHWLIDEEGRLPDGAGKPSEMKKAADGQDGGQSGNTDLTSGERSIDLASVVSPCVEIKRVPGSTAGLWDPKGLCIPLGPLRTRT